MCTDTIEQLFFLPCVSLSRFLSLILSLSLCKHMRLLMFTALKQLVLSAVCVQWESVGLSFVRITTKHRLTNVCIGKCPLFSLTKPPADTEDVKKPEPKALLPNEFYLAFLNLQIESSLTKHRQIQIQTWKSQHEMDNIWKGKCQSTALFTS